MLPSGAWNYSTLGLPASMPATASRLSSKSPRRRMKCRACTHTPAGNWSNDLSPNSVWKPLRGPVRNSPLAVCDYRTVGVEDRVPTDIIFPDYMGETYDFWPNPRHRFYFLDQQAAHEAWMIKCFDSATTANPDIAQCRSSQASLLYLWLSGLPAHQLPRMSHSRMDPLGMTPQDGRVLKYERTCSIEMVAR